jgi:hypothetical protein
MHNKNLVMQLLLVVDDCEGEGQPWEFYWRCDSGVGLGEVCARCLTKIF